VLALASRQSELPAFFFRKTPKSAKSDKPKNAMKISRNGAKHAKKKGWKSFK